MTKSRKISLFVIVVSILLVFTFVLSSCNVLSSKKYAQVRFQTQAGDNVAFSSVVVGPHIYVFAQGVEVPNADDYDQPANYRAACSTKSYMGISFSDFYGADTSDFGDGGRVIDVKCDGSSYWMMITINKTSPAYSPSKHIYVNGIQLTPGGDSSYNELIDSLVFDNYGLSKDKVNVIEYK